MSFAWLFPAEAPLPLGYRLVVLENESAALGAGRLGAAAAVAGADAAKALARKLGRYELDEDAVARLALAGVATGEEGEIPALSPARWADPARAESWESLRAGLALGDAVAGLALRKDQRDGFLRFLTRNHEPDAGELDAEKAVRLARHFFFQEPLVLVVRYTPPRFAHS